MINYLFSCSIFLLQQQMLFQLGVKNMTIFSLFNQWPTALGATGLQRYMQCRMQNRIKCLVMWGNGREEVVVVFVLSVSHETSTYLLLLRLANLKFIIALSEENQNRKDRYPLKLHNH